VVRLLADNQIADRAPVTVEGSGQLDLGYSNDTIGRLLMTGGRVTGAGTLTLNGDVTVPFAAEGNPPTISAALSLGTAARTVTVDAAASALVINGVISGGAGAGLVKAGAGTLEFAGPKANTYSGTTAVSAGTLRLNKNAGMTAVPGPLVIGDGTGTDVVTTAAGQQISSRAKVTVNSSGQLNIGGHLQTIALLTMTGGQVQLNASTLRIDGDVTATSATATNPAQILGGRDSALRFGTLTPTFHVPQGPGGPDLIVSTSIRSVSGVGVTKTGAGTLRLGGNSSNLYDGPTTVKAGVLELDKTDGAQAVLGPLVIGDGTGGPNADVVRLLAANQIADNVPVTVNRFGRLDLNNQNDTIGPLTLTGASVTTGTGVLTLDGDVTMPGATTDPPSRISGRLSLGSATRTFDVVYQDPALAPALIVDAVISGAPGVGLTEVGAGTVQFEGSAPNTYTGTTTVNGGLLDLEKSSGNAVVGPLVIGDGNAFDAVRLLAPNEVADTSPVTVNNRALFDVTRSDTIGPLTLTGGRVRIGSDATLTLNGNVTATSTAAKTGSATITGGTLGLGPMGRTFTVNAGGVADADLVFQGNVSAPSGGPIKEGRGTLLMSGPTYSPVAVTVTVNAGTLRIDGNRPTTTVLLNAGTLEATHTIRSITSATGAAKTVRAGTPQACGVLDVAGKVSFSATTTFEVKVKGGSSPKPGVDFDQLTVGGPVDLNGARLVVTPTNFLAPPVGTRYRIIHTDGAGALLGEFANVPRADPLLLVQVSSTQSALFQLDYAAGSGKDVDLIFLGLVQ
jgi:autotransporter-associated beta strand protein